MNLNVLLVMRLEIISLLFLESSNPGCPRLAYPSHLFKEFATRNLRTTDLPFCPCCQWAMLIRLIKRVSEKTDICCLKSLECLYQLLVVFLAEEVKLRTGLRSASRKPKAISPLFVCPSATLRPSMSTITTSLMPVFVSQPYIARRSSIA